MVMVLFTQAVFRCPSDELVRECTGGLSALSPTTVVTLTLFFKPYLVRFLIFISIAVVFLPPLLILVGGIKRKFRNNFKIPFT